MIILYIATKGFIGTGENNPYLKKQCSAGRQKAELRNKVQGHDMIWDQRYFGIRDQGF